MLKKELQPTKVQKIYCPVCGELEVKIYPWSSYRLKEGDIIHNCRKCIAKDIKKRRLVV